MSQVTVMTSILSSKKNRLVKVKSTTLHPAVTHLQFRGCSMSCEGLLSAQYKNSVC